MVITLSPNAERVAQLRYCRPGETFDDVLHRVARAVANVERDTYGATEETTRAWRRSSTN